MLVALSIGRLMRIDAPRAITDANVLIPLFVFNVLAGPLGEELGWRGTALPRLLARWGALTSSLILGSVCWTFHTPGFVLGHSALSCLVREKQQHCRNAAIDVAWLLQR